MDLDIIPTKITTSIPYEVFRNCKQNGWKWNELIMSGYRLRVTESDFPKRIFQLESQITALKEELKKKASKQMLFRNI